MKDKKAILKQQKEICKKYNSEFSDIEMSLKVGIALDTLCEMPIHAVRHKQERGTTGWYIWGGEYSESPDFYKPLCAEHLSEYLPIILKYLRLSPGYRIIIDDKGYEDVWFDENV